jgi:hypothetical protein
MINTPLLNHIPEIHSMRILSLGAAALALLLASNASADWQYTRWNMTRTEVEAAAPNKAVLLSSQESVAKSSAASREIAVLKAPYSSGEYQFDAIFRFDKQTQRLSSVSLELQTKDKTAQLFGDLRTKYGTPVSEKDSAILQYVMWYSGGDQISIIAIGEDNVSVTYQPRANPNNSGL